MVSHCVYPLSLCIFTIMFWIYPINPFCFRYIWLHLFDYSIVFYNMNVIQYIRQFPCWWIFNLCPNFCYCKQYNKCLQTYFIAYINVPGSRITKDMLICNLLYFAKLFSKMFVLLTVMYKNFYFFKFLPTLGIVKFFNFFH